MTETEWRARAVELEGDKRKLLERVKELEVSLCAMNTKLTIEWARAEDAEAERDSLRDRVKELELSLIAIGDMAVTDFDDAVVGKVDAVVGRLKGSTYAARLKSLFAAKAEAKGLRDRVGELERSLAKRCDKCEFCNACDVIKERDSLKAKLGRAKESAKILVESGLDFDDDIWKSEVIEGKG